MPYLWTWYDNIDIGIPNTNNAIEGMFSDLKNKLRNYNLRTHFLGYYRSLSLFISYLFSFYRMNDKRSKLLLGKILFRSMVQYHGKLLI